jgi:peptidoglycan/xylan/chitin deacetylase (PgdA/CDA1 family)
MAGEGLTIGGHTRGHPKLNLLSPEEMEEEIAGSCEVIRGLSGQENVPFAFPFSAYGVPRETLAGILSRHAYIGMLFDSKGIRRDRPFIMNRIMADKPFPGQQAGTDLPQHLHRAYEDVFLLKVRRRGIS